MDNRAVMIPAPPGIIARYKNDKPEPFWTIRRVVTFDDDWARRDNGTLVGGKRARQVTR